MNRKEKILRYFRAFLRGMSDVLVLSHSPIEPPPRLQQKRQSDWEAIAGDWLRVGNDLRKAMGEAPITAAGLPTTLASSPKGGKVEGGSVPPTT